VKIQYHTYYEGIEQEKRIVMEKKTALIVGSTGLVGNELLHILLNSQEYQTIYALVRRPLEISHPHLIEVICNFEELNEVEQYFTVNDVFCTLGTTLKKAKTKEAMYRIDVEYPIAVAELARQHGAKHFLIVSSLQANKNSRIWYSKMKGELEEQLKQIPYETLSIFQPALLLGNRQEFRLFEKLGINIVRTVGAIFGKGLRSSLGIEAKTVAKAMYEVAQEEKKGIHVYTSRQMASFQENL